MSVTFKRSAATNEPTRLVAMYRRPSLRKEPFQPRKRRSSDGTTNQRTAHSASMMTPVKTTATTYAPRYSRSPAPKMVPKKIPNGTE